MNKMGLRYAEHVERPFFRWLCCVFGHLDSALLRPLSTQIYMYYIEAMHFGSEMIDVEWLERFSQFYRYQRLFFTYFKEPYAFDFV